jgi:hypothetical protein
MKNYIYYILLVFMMFSCEDDFLDIDPKTELTAEVVFKDAALAEKAVLGAYRGLWTVDGFENFNTFHNSVLVDESVFNGLVFSWLTVWWEGKISPDNPFGLGGFGGYGHDRKELHRWDHLYKWIRQANLMIEGLTESTLDEDLKNTLLGESYFLRAIYHYYVWVHFGGASLVDKTFTADEDLTSYIRSSFAETVEFIVSDLDTAFDYLDGKSLERGRTNASAALALKSRVLTYAASDLYEPSKNNKSLHASYANKELIMYSGNGIPEVANSQEKRWRRAQAASLAAMNYNSSYNYHLSNGSPLDKETAYNIYNDLYSAGSMQEAMFERVIDKSYDTDPLGWGSLAVNWWYGPGGYHYGDGNGAGLSATAPHNEFADDFQYAEDTNGDGIIDIVEDFSWTNSAHTTKPFKNRDPRMEATIGIEDGRWLGPRYYDWQVGSNPYFRAVDNSATGRLQLGKYEMPASGDYPSGTVHGLDNMIVGNIEVQGGYSHKKHLSHTPDPNLGSFATWWTSTPQVILRHTETLLNYAEASIALGEEANAKATLNLIRYRAGMPALTETGSDLLARYRNERRLELSFEGHRFYDVRRWGIGPKLTMTGVKISGELKPGVEPFDFYSGYDESKYDYSYETFPIDYYNTIVFPDKYYFRPIETTILQKHPGLIQNPGY